MVYGLREMLVSKYMMTMLFQLTWKRQNYRNDPTFSDRYAWANSEDPDQTARSSLIMVYTVYHSLCIVWTHYSMVEPHSSNFRVITTNVLGVRIFRKFTVLGFLFFNSWSLQGFDSLVQNEMQTQCQTMFCVLMLCKCYFSLISPGEMISIERENLE